MKEGQEAAQIVQLGAANLTVAHNLELRDVRGVYREGFLDAYTVGNTADGNRLVNAGVLLGNDDAFENLNTLTVAFLDLRVYLYGIADLEFRYLFTLYVVPHDAVSICLGLFS